MDVPAAPAPTDHVPLLRRGDLGPALFIVGIVVFLGAVLWMLGMGSDYESDPEFESDVLAFAERFRQEQVPYVLGGSSDVARFEELYGDVTHLVAHAAEQACDAMATGRDMGLSAFEWRRQADMHLRTTFPSVLADLYSQVALSAVELCSEHREWFLGDPGPGPRNPFEPYGGFQRS